MRGLDHELAIFKKFFKDSEIYPILERVLEGEDLTFKEYVELLESQDIHALGFVANVLTNTLTKNYVSIVNNVVVNYSNICVARCPLCAFYRDPNSSEAYTLQPKEILEQVYNAWVKYGVTEVHFNGGFNPELSIEYFEEAFKYIKSKIPSIIIKGLTMAEVWFYAKIWRMSYREILERLKISGLDVICGGGAEIYSEEVRKIIAPRKLSGEEWIRIAEIAHSLGIPSNATILYGHVEKSEHIIEHLLKVRELQEKTNGILMFIPLKFSPWNTELHRKGLVKELAPAVLDLKITALSRIVLKDKVVKIGAYWIGLGKKLAQVMLNFGANDLVGTMINERVYREAGRAEMATMEELSHMVREVGKTLVLRDTFHKVIKVLEMN
ncbi:MAG: aminofutalosine synthase MqnE [Thermoprotei archaeon ex4572_64]|nr:MAG: aminofutalosine synthase MqnE [Thermoprotei archaeon ex4572_64]